MFEPIEYKIDMRLTRYSFRLGFLLLLAVAQTTHAYRDSDDLVNYGSFKYVITIATSINRSYVVTTQGIIVFNKIQNRWETPLAGRDGIDAGRIREIWVDQFDERLFAKTDIGLYEYDLTFERWTTAFELPAMQSTDQNLRPPASLFAPFGYEYNGFGLLTDPQRRQFEISAVVEDGTGTLWIGTWGKGVFRAGSRNSQMELLPFGLLSDEARLLYFADSLLYVSGGVSATSHSGVTIFNPRDEIFQFIESGPSFDLPSEEILSISTNRDRLLIGTARGLYELDQKSHRVRDRLDRRLGIRSETFTAIAPIGDSVFLGTDDGLCLLTRSDKEYEFTAYPTFQNQPIFDLAIVRNQLWIACDKGAFRLSLETGTLQKFSDPDRLLFNRAYDIDIAGSNLWLSSTAGAVSIDLDSGVTKPYQITSRQTWRRPIAANDRIAAIASDRGVTLIFPDEDRWLSREVTTQDGLPSPAVLALQFVGPYLWVGTDKGLSRIDWNSTRLRP